MSQREARRVPPDWVHPKDAQGRFIPLRGDYGATAREFIRGARLWSEGYVVKDLSGAKRPLQGDELNQTYEEHQGPRPKPEDYLPMWPQEKATHWQMYETTTKGTPISPVMATQEALATWLSANHANAFGDTQATYEEWLHCINTGRFTPL